MFTFPNWLLPYVNYFLILWFLIVLMRGYKQGLLLQILELGRGFVALFIAWLFAPVFVNVYPFIKPSGIGLVTVDQMITKQSNTLIWFVILYLLSKILLYFVTPIVSFVSKIPLVKQVNSAVGGVFSIVVFGIKLALLSVFLSFPLISNGQEIVENSFLEGYVEFMRPRFAQLEQSYFRNEGLQALLSERKLSEEQIEEMSKWLEEKGFNEREIKEYLESHE